MAFKKRSWISHHILTHHHIIVDRLVRVALVFLVLILGAAFFVTRWQNAVVKVSAVITGPDWATTKEVKDFVVDVANAGKDVRSGVTVAITSSPGLIIESIDGGVYPAGGIIPVDKVLAGSQTRLNVSARAVSLGSQEIRVEVRRASSSKVLAQRTHTLEVTKPALKATVSARYYSPEGEQFGRGPLPPKVGETTMYYVTMQIPYSEYAWKNVEVSAALGAGVVWADFVPQGAKGFRYDASSNRVIWQIQSWPASETLSDAGVFFGVKLLPAASDAGSVAVLLNNIRVHAVASDGERFTANLPSVTTDLRDDAKAAGKSVVVP